MKPMQGKAHPLAPLFSMLSSSAPPQPSPSSSNEVHNLFDSQTPTPTPLPTSSTMTNHQEHDLPPHQEDVDYQAPHQNLPPIDPQIQVAMMTMVEVMT